MKSKWFVQYNPVGGDTPYIITRWKDEDEVHHSGNMEHYGTYSADRAALMAKAEELNMEEEGCQS